MNKNFAWIAVADEESKIENVMHHKFGLNQTRVKFWICGHCATKNQLKNVQWCQWKRLDERIFSDVYFHPREGDPNSCRVKQNNYGKCWFWRFWKTRSTDDRVWETWFKDKFEWDSTILWCKIWLKNIHSSSLLKIWDICTSIFNFNWMIGYLKK